MERKYCKLFESHEDYLTFINSSTYEEPNISICKLFDEDHVHFNPIERMIVCVFNVTDISEPTQIIGYTDSHGTENTDYFIYIEIDGVIMNPVHEYQFESTGTHIVKYLPAYQYLTDGTLNPIPVTSIKFPYTIKNIGMWAFVTSTTDPITIDLNSVEILDGQSIACFTNSVYIPKTVTQYGRVIEATLYQSESYKPPFLGKIDNVTVDSENPIYDSRNNCNAVIETATNKLLQGFTNTVIPNTVTSIMSNAFSNSHKTTITIPSSVTSIGQYAFSECNSLTSVYVQATVPPTLGYNAFGTASDESQIKIYVPAASLSDYEQATNWDVYYNSGQLLANPS